MSPTLSIQKYAITVTQENELYHYRSEVRTNVSYTAQPKFQFRIIDSDTDDGDVAALKPEDNRNDAITWQDASRNYHYLHLRI